MNLRGQHDESEALDDPTTNSLAALRTGRCSVTHTWRDALQPGPQGVAWEAAQSAGAAAPAQKLTTEHTPLHAVSEGGSTSAAAARPDRRDSALVAAALCPLARDGRGTREGWGPRADTTACGRRRLRLTCCAWREDYVVRDEGHPDGDAQQASTALVDAGLVVRVAQSDGCRGSNRIPLGYHYTLLLRCRAGVFAVCRGGGIVAGADPKGQCEQQRCRHSPVDSRA